MENPSRRLPLLMLPPPKLFFDAQPDRHPPFSASGALRRQCDTGFKLPHTSSLASYLPVDTEDENVFRTQDNTKYDTLETHFFHSKLHQHILQLERFQQRELLLLEQLKTLNYRTAQGNTDKITSKGIKERFKFLGQEMRGLFTEKRKALQSLLNADDFETKAKKDVVAPKPLNLLLTQQPPETAIANRYITPGITISVQNFVSNKKASTAAVPSSDDEDYVDEGDYEDDEEFRCSRSKSSQSFDASSPALIVTAKLYYYLQEEELLTTIDGKQDVLQGAKKVVVDKTGTAVFNRLKVMEVSSKHKHQAFCFVFSLEEISGELGSGSKVLSQIKSSPFQVQSRPNKRKSWDDGDDDVVPAPKFSMNLRGVPPTTMKLRSQPGSTNSSPSASPALVPAEAGAGAWADSPSSSPALTPANTHSSPSGNGDYHYVDITELLVLPQKEAAAKLGISESMLCKRFKECTRRKWPYRYLKKIDKVINMLHMHKGDAPMLKEDKEKLDSLLRDREDCLRPVKIRITSQDRTLAALQAPQQLSNSPSPSSSPQPSSAKCRTDGALSLSSSLPASPLSCASSLDGEEDQGEGCLTDEIPDDVLETLEMLKTRPLDQ